MDGGNEGQVPRRADTGRRRPEDTDAVALAASDQANDKKDQPSTAGASAAQDTGSGTSESGGGGTPEDSNSPSVTQEGGGRFLTQMLASMQHGATGGFGGMCMQYTSVAFPSFLEDPRTHPISQNLIAGIVSSFYAGSIIGYFIGAFVVQRQFSKRVFLMFSFLPMTVSWIPFMLITDPALMTAARILQGIVFGSRSNVSFAYVMEIADGRARNWGISMYALAIGAGTLFVAILGAFVRWDVLSMVCSAVGAAFVPLTFRLPDTPLHWLRRDEELKARRSLQTYRSSTHDVEKELQDLKQYIFIGTANFSWRRIHHKQYALPLAIVLLFNMLKPWLGYPVMVGYTVEILQQLRLTGPITPTIANVIIQVADFVAQFLSTFAVMCLNRKIQMSVGCFAMALANGLNGLYAFFISKAVLEDRDGGQNKTYSAFLLNASSWWPALGFSIWFCSYSIGMANALHLVMGEILPSHVSAFGVAGCFVVLTINQFILTSCFYYLVELVQIPGVLWLFSGTALILGVLACLVVRDTRNKSLLELEAQHQEQPTVQAS